MIEPVDPDYTQGDGQFCPHSPLHSLHNNSLLSRREEGRKEGEGRKLRWKKSNCWSKCEVKCSGSAKREGAVSYSERCGFSVGSFLSLFIYFLFFLSIIDEKNPHLDQYYQISFSGALSLALKSIFFFLSHATFEITPVMGWAIILLSLTLCCRSDCAAQTQRLVEKLPKLPCLLLFVYVFDIVIANTSFCCSPGPPQHAGLTAWRNGIGCVWRDVPGQHVRPGLLG